MGRNTLSSPVIVWAMGAETRRIVVSWTSSFSPHTLVSEQLPEGTVLLRTGGDWDSLVGFGVHCGGVLRPGVIFKNPIPLWHYSVPTPNSVVATVDWPELRRRIHIHNPGLDGVLHLLDCAVRSSLHVR